MPDLKGMIFLNPQTNQWETDDQYLSGNVREKLAAADAAAVTDPRFRENVEALKSVQPADLPATEIDVRLGAAWLPPEDVQQFVQELLGVSSGVEIGHIHALGSWHVNAELGGERRDRQHDRLGHRPLHRPRIDRGRAQSQNADGL